MLSSNSKPYSVSTLIILIMGLFDIFKKTSAPLIRLSHADYNNIIQGVEVDGMAVTHVPIGNVDLPSGRIVVCDQLAIPEMPPLTRTVLPGSYPVVLHYVDTGDSGQRVAIAVLTVRDQPAVRFELAVRPGEDISTLEDEHDFFGFPVDAGLGSFMDAETSVYYLKWLDQFHKANPEGNVYDDFFAEKFARNAAFGYRDGDWVNHRFNERPDLNLTMFSSGYGDGMYPAYWGVDAAGEIVCLVIDFHVALTPE